MFNILKLNEISKQATKALDSNYSLSNDCANPEAIILRSFDMHDYTTGSNLLAVVRAGAGVNNIPIEEMTAKQVAVFNTPGANSNAVKELAICALLLGSRKIVEGIEWTKSLIGKGDEVPALVEKGKKAFVGGELKGKKLGVVGLGAIGRMVANTACDLGMEVLGYDPYLSIDGAWSLKEKVQHITSLNKIFTNCDYITLHVPMTDSTKNCINAETISLMKNDVVILNLARGGLVNDDDIIAALEKNEVGCYITDLPNEKLLNAKNCICIPHLGASTPEAEDNCATMAVFELKEYLESG
ncbi:MAG: 3-phosphoglycerate dehydrogenase, partial [Clostridia bacterium]